MESSSLTKDQTDPLELGVQSLSLWITREIPFLFFFFFFNKNNQFLKRILFLAVLGLHCCTQAFSSCGRRASHSVASLIVEHRLYLGLWTSVVAVPRL